MAVRPINAISLFSGGGGLDLGLGLAIRGHRTVCYVEREAYAASILVAAMEAGRLVSASVWSDVATFDGKAWRGCVDLVAGGFPCQDISCAGTRVGIDGPRSGLWSEFARIVREVEPSIVFVENVAALVTGGLDRVLGDLAELGFDAEWDVFRASDVGAPHLRKRVFILAYAGRIGIDGLQSIGVSWSGDQAIARDGLKGMANANGDGQHGERISGVLDGERAPFRNDADGRDPSMANAVFSGLERAEHEKRRSAVADGRIPFPPGPGDRAGWAVYLSNWYDIEPAVRRGADGMADHVDQLRMLGNGVVPAQAALAFRTLYRRIIE